MSPKILLKIIVFCTLSLALAFAMDNVIAGDILSPLEASRELRKDLAEKADSLFSDSVLIDIDLNEQDDKLINLQGLILIRDTGDTIKISDKSGPLYICDCNKDSIPDIVQKTEKNFLVYINSALPLLNSQLIPIQEDSLLFIELANNGLAKDVNYELKVRSGSISLKRDKRGVEITPDENWNGNASLGIKYSKGNLQDSVTYSIIVLPANDAPYVYREREKLIIDEDSKVAIPVDSLMACVVDDDGKEDLTIKLLGNKQRCRLINKEYIYKPEANWFGEDSLLFIISDGEASDTLVQHITVNAVNDIPVWTKIKPVSFPEDEYYQLPFETFYKHVSDVETPDSLLRFHVFSGEHVSISAEGGKITLIADENWFGTEEVLLRVSDGEAKAEMSWTIELTPVNDAPVLYELPDTMFFEDEKLLIPRKELERYAYDVESPDAELNWQVRKLGKIRAHYNGLRIRCAGSKDWYGTDSLELTVSDGELRDSRIWRVHILPVNDPPQWLRDGQQRSFMEDEKLELLKKDLYSMVRDPETQAKDLSWTLMPASHIYFSENEKGYTFSADKNWYGNSNVHMIVNDGEYADTLNYKFRVLSVNDKPHLSDIPKHSWKEDDTLGISKSYLNKYVRDVETKRSDLIWTYFSDKPEVSIKKRKNGITLSSARDWNGSAKIGMIVYDGGMRDTGYMKIEVTPVNDAPRWQALPDTNIAEDGLLRIPLSFIRSFVSDPDMGDKIEVSYKAGDKFYIDEKKEVLEIWPHDDWFGTEKIEFTASDGKKKVKSTWNIPIFAVNDPPYFTIDLPDSISFRANGTDTLIFDEIVYDVDNKISELEWEISEGNITRHMFDDKIGGIIFYSESFASGEDMITIRVSDGHDVITAHLPVLVKEVDRFLMGNPVKLELLPNTPNPFRDYTDIRFSMPVGGHVTLKIYDLLGQEIITLTQGYHDPQNYSFRWFGTTASGMPVPSGVYLCRMSAVIDGDPAVMMQKMMLVR